MPAQASFRIVYHVGPSLNLSTKVRSGKAEVDGKELRISGEEELRIAREEIRDTTLYRLHGLGRMIRFTWRDATVFLTVVRLNVFGYFIVINFLATGRLYRLLNSAAETA
jgi:hypothetical protein